MIIDQLPSLNNTTNTDELPIERGTNTYKITFQTLFSTINSALSTAITDLQTLIAAKVAKAGDTMTGDLTVSIAEPHIFVKCNTADISEDSPTAQKQWLFGATDKNGKYSAMWQTLMSTAGTVTTRIRARRLVSGSNVNNDLDLTVSKTGVLGVALSAPKAWRSALGFGSSGDLPITIGQGGTGQTGVNTSTVVSALVASDATGFSTQAVYFKTWGKIAQIAIGFKVSSTGSVSNKKVCTLVTGAKPSGITSCLFDTNVMSYAYISTAGEVYVTGNFSSTSTTYYIRAIYLLI